MKSGKRLTLICVAVCAAALLLAPAGASAAKSVYHPTKQARNFAGGDGGWRGTTSFDGACVQTLTCPQVTNSFVASGGLDGTGDGHLRTEISALAGRLAISRGMYTSPTFTYRGVGGAKASKLTLSLHRRSNLAPLLAVDDNKATYSVELLDQTSGRTKTLIGDKQLVDTDGWNEVPAVSLAPGTMQIGHRYELRITSEFVTGLLVVDGGSADYDNVRLVAEGPKGSGSSGGSNGSGGSGNPGKGPGSGAIGGGIKPAKVKHHGKRVKVRYRCPKSTRPSACDAKLSLSLKRKGKRVTRNRTVRVRPGHHRSPQLRVKRGFRHKVARRHKVFVHARVRAKGHVYHVTRKVKIHRHG